MKLRHYYTTIKIDKTARVVGTMARLFTFFLLKWQLKLLHRILSGPMVGVPIFSKTYLWVVETLQKFYWHPRTKLKYLSQLLHSFFGFEFSFFFNSKSYWFSNQKWRVFWNFRRRECVWRSSLNCFIWLLLLKNNL